MPRLPSSSDVQTVRPGRDPGVQVPSVQVPRTQVPSAPSVREPRIPSGAFESTTGAAAEEFAPAIEKMAQVARAQESRRDTVDRADKINQYTLGADEELRRFNVESDLSRDEVLQEYGQVLSKRRQELLNEHEGTEESRALLGIRLQEVESTAIGKASAISSRLGREKVVKVYNDRLDPLVQSAARDSSRKNIDQQFLALETTIDDLRGAFDPSEENEMRQRGREQIALSAVNSLVARGRIEEADSLIQGGLSQSLSAETERDMVRRIEDVRFARDEFMRKKTEAEAFLGRSLTENEALGMLGLSQPQEDLVAIADDTSPTGMRFVTKSQAVDQPAPSEGKMTDRQREIQNMVNRGMDPDLAQDIGNGNVRVVGPDNMGNFYSVNVVTNDRTLIPERQARAIVGIVTDNVQQVASGQREDVEQPEVTEQPGRSIEQASQTGTGPFSQIQAGISNVFGPFIEGSLFEETTQSRQQIRTFNQIAKTGLVNNPRFPVAEQQIVQNLLPDPDAFFKDPDTARSDLQELRNSLNSFKSAKQKELDGNITTTRRGDLADQISRIDELLSLMESGEETPTVSSQEEINQLESGTRFIWTDGNEYIKD